MCSASAAYEGLINRSTVQVGAADPGPDVVLVLGVRPVQIGVVDLDPDRSGSTADMCLGYESAVKKASADRSAAAVASVIRPVEKGLSLCNGGFGSGRERGGKKCESRADCD